MGGVGAAGGAGMAGMGMGAGSSAGMTGGGRSLSSLASESSSETLASVTNTMGQQFNVGDRVGFTGNGGNQVEGNFEGSRGNYGMVRSDDGALHMQPLNFLMIISSKDEDDENKTTIIMAGNMDGAFNMMNSPAQNMINSAVVGLMANGMQAVSGMGGGR